MAKNNIKQVKANISLESVIFEELNLKRFPTKQGEFDMKISPFGRFIKSSKKFQLNLLIELSDKNEAFKMKLNSVALFKIEENYNIEENDSLFFVNAPAILFPYVRAYINSITALSGLKPIILPIMNLAFLKGELKKNTTFE